MSLLLLLDEVPEPMNVGEKNVVSVATSLTIKIPRIYINVANAVGVSSVLTNTFFNRWRLVTASMAVVSDVPRVFMQPRLSTLASARLQFLVRLYDSADDTYYYYTDGDTVVVDDPVLGEGYTVVWNSRIRNALVITRSLPDSLYGVMSVDSFSLDFDNSAKEFNTWLSTDIGDWLVHVWRYDAGDGSVIYESSGIIETVSGGTIVTVEVSAAKLTLLENEWPDKTVETKDFPKVPESDAGSTVPYVFGIGRKIPCRLVDTVISDPNPDNWTYDFIVGRPNLGIDTVYSDGMVVSPDNYDIISNYGYPDLDAAFHDVTAIRIHGFHPYGGEGGQLCVIAADVHGVYPPYNSPAERNGEWKFNSSLADTSGNGCNLSGVDILESDYVVGATGYGLNAIEFARSAQKLLTPVAHAEDFCEAQFTLRLRMGVNDYWASVFTLMESPCCGTGGGDWGGWRMNLTINGSSYNLAFTLYCSGSSTATVTAYGISTGAWHDIVIYLNPNLGSHGRVSINVDSTYYTHTSLTNDFIYDYDAGSSSMTFNKDGPFRGCLGYLAYEPLAVTSLGYGYLKSPFWCHESLKRNGVAAVLRLLCAYDSDVTLDDFHDSANFAAAAADWDAIDGGQGLCVDLALVDKEQAKTVLDQILCLRSAWLSLYGRMWQINIDRAANLAAVPPFGLGAMPYNILSGPTYARKAPSESVKKLKVRYRPRRDPASKAEESKESDSYTFTIESTISTIGKDFEVQLPYVFDGRSAAVYLQYYGRILNAIKRSTEFTVTELSGRLVQLGDVIRQSAAPYDVTDEYFRVCKEVRSLADYVFTAYSYDASAYDALIAPDIPPDPEGYTIADFSVTPPEPPTNLAFVSYVPFVGQFSTSVVVTLSVTPPVINVSKIGVEAWRESQLDQTYYRYKEVACTPGVSVNIVMDSLDPGTHHHFKAFALNSYGMMSSESANLEYDTPGDTAVSTNDPLEVSPKGTRILEDGTVVAYATIQFSVPISSPAVRAQIRATRSGETDPEFTAEFPIVRGGTFTHTFHFLMIGTSYSVVVRSFTADNDSADSLPCVVLPSAEIVPPEASGWYLIGEPVRVSATRFNMQLHLCRKTILHPDGGGGGGWEAPTSPPGHWTILDEDPQDSDYISHDTVTDADGVYEWVTLGPSALPAASNPIAFRVHARYNGIHDGIGESLYLCWRVGAGGISTKYFPGYLVGSRSEVTFFTMNSPYYFEYYTEPPDMVLTRLTPEALEDLQIAVCLVHPAGGAGEQVSELVAEVYYKDYSLLASDYSDILWYRQSKGLGVLWPSPPNPTVASPFQVSRGPEALDSNLNLSGEYRWFIALRDRTGNISELVGPFELSTPSIP